MKKTNISIIQKLPEKYNIPYHVLGFNIPRRAEDVIHVCTVGKVTTQLDVTEHGSNDSLSPTSEVKA